MKFIAIKKLAVSLAGICLLSSSLAWSGTVVIVNVSNTSDISASDIERIFLGKKKTFPNGNTAIPVDQSEGSAVRTQFESQVLGKSAQQLKAYWSQRLFTGKGTPPTEMSSDAEVKKQIAENPALIGYIDSAAVDKMVRVVHQF